MVYGDLEGGLDTARAACAVAIAGSHLLHLAATSAARLLEVRGRTVPDSTATDFLLEAEHWRALSDDAKRFSEKWSGDAGRGTLTRHGDMIATLSESELEIVRLLPSSLNFAELARHIGTTVEVTKARIIAIYRKLGAASRNEAVARAVEFGMLGADDRWEKGGPPARP